MARPPAERYPGRWPCRAEGCRAGAGTRDPALCCGALFCTAVVTWGPERWQDRAAKARSLGALRAEARQQGRAGAAYTAPDGTRRPLLPPLNAFDRYALALHPEE